MTLNSYTIAAPQFPQRSGQPIVEYRRLHISISSRGSQKHKATIAISELHVKFEAMNLDGTGDYWYETTAAVGHQTALTIGCILEHSGDGQSWTSYGPATKSSAAGDTSYTIVAGSQSDGITVEFEFIPTYILQLPFGLPGIHPPSNTVFKIEPLPTHTIKNGDFESGVAPGSFSKLAADAGDIRGWTIGLGGVDYTGTYWHASTGARSLDLNMLTPGSISQEIDTIAGQSYLVVFAMAGNPAGNPDIKTLEVEASGGVPQTYKFDKTGKSLTNMGWVDKVYKFTAASSKTTLTFTSKTNGGCGPALDNVRIYAE